MINDLWNAFKNLMHDNDGAVDLRMVLILISLLGVFLTATISHQNNKKTLKQQKELHREDFKKDVVATSRIEWIQEVRKKSVDFIADGYTLLDFIRNTERTKENEKKFKRLRDEVGKSGNLLILYFGPDKFGNNDYIVYFVTKLLDTFKDYAQAWDEKKMLNEVEGILYSLRDFLRIYFKAEWKRANGEINDVQAYLNEQALYITITEIYCEELEDYHGFVETMYNVIDFGNQFAKELSLEAATSNDEDEDGKSL